MDGLSWEGRQGETAMCVRCLEEKYMALLDHLFWCDSCRRRAKRRARRAGALAGAAGTLLVFWVGVLLRPAADPARWAWLVAAMAGVYLGARVVREVAWAVMRIRNRRAVEAVPPVAPPQATDPPRSAEPPRPGGPSAFDSPPLPPPEPPPTPGFQPPLDPPAPEPWLGAEPLLPEPPPPEPWKPSVPEAPDLGSPDAWKLDQPDVPGLPPSEPWERRDPPDDTAEPPKAA